MTSSDDELLARARDGDEAAFDALVSRHQERVVRIAYRFLYDEDGAKDMAQEVFLAAFLRLPTWEAGQPFAPWVYRVAANKAVERARKRSSRRQIERVSARMRAGSSSRKEAQPSDETVRLRRAMGRLSERQRKVVSLHFFEHFSLASTAKMLGIAASTARVTLSKAIRILRRRLSKPP